MNKLVLSLFIIGTTLSATACTSRKNLMDSSMIDPNSSSIIITEESSSVEGSINTKDVQNDTKKTNSMNKSVKTIKIPITLMPKDVKGEKSIKYLEISEDSTREEKVELIVNAISKECFNGLPINVTLYEDRQDARVELIEPENVQNSRVSWENDYLNEQVKEHTVGVILKNILQEDYKGNWIENVQLYYEGELISLD